jgi:hypothetical protein
MCGKLDANERQEQSQSYPGMFESCRARALGIPSEFGECLIEPLQHCKYRLSFGDGHYCHHPNLRAIIEKS